jgi:REP element-mobilizing transposase RayT
MPRILAALTWYWVVTAINRHESLFLDRAAVDLFNRVLREAGERFAIEVRRLVIQADRVSFYIKPADGFMLPEIMQWIKQTFACRYNALKHLDGHVWGDRYWSKVIDGEPREEEIPAGGTGRGDCVERRATEEEEGGQIPKARPWEGPPGGDSHRVGETAQNTPKATLINLTLIGDLLILLRKHRIKAALAALAHSRLNKSALP